MQGLVAMGLLLPALARVRLRRVTFHTLRHCCASAMIANGAFAGGAASIGPCQSKYYPVRLFASLQRLGKRRRGRLAAGTLTIALSGPNCRELEKSRRLWASGASDRCADRL